MTPMPIWRVLLLHLVPGAIATLVFILLAGTVEGAGYPPLAALLIAIALVIIPFELGVILLAIRPERGLLAAIPYRDRMTARDWLILVPVLVVAGILGFGFVGVVEPLIRDALFGWLPGWYRDPLSTDDIGRYSTTAWTTTLGAYVVLNVLAGPIVEELYFRGYLLPRMAQFGRWAPLVNTILFSLYHFWSPWQFLTRIAGVTPFAYAVWRKRNVYLGAVVHVLLNAIGTLTLILFITNSL